MKEKEYKFTEDWFKDVAQASWEQLFPLFPKPNKVLEVGCFEGRATVWLCDNVLAPGTQYDVIDTFEGSVNEAGMQRAVQGGISFIESNFKHNIEQHPDINFTIHKGISQLVLPTLPLVETYDFIYIDASHRSDDTFVDAYYAHKLLKPGGLIIFDDFAWKDPNDPRPVNSPELGVRAFAVLYSDLYDVVMEGYQIGLTKKQSNA